MHLFLPHSPEGLSGYCFHTWCPDGRAAGRSLSGLYLGNCKVCDLDLSGLYLGNCKVCDLDLTFDPIVTLTYKILSVLYLGNCKV